MKQLQPADSSLWVALMMVIAKVESVTVADGCIWLFGRLSWTRSKLKRVILILSQLISGYGLFLFWLEGVINVSVLVSKNNFQWLLRGVFIKNVGLCVCTSYVEVLPLAGRSPLAPRHVRTITASYPERTVRDPEGGDGESSPQIGQCLIRWRRLKTRFCTLDTVFFYDYVGCVGFQ